MDDGDFNFYRICIVEKNVALLALKELFETLWERKYPAIPWTKDSACVTLFEQKEDELFENGVAPLPSKEKRRKQEKRLQRQRSFRDSHWTNYVWDTSKVVHALVDSKLFVNDLTIADEDGVQVSEHIVKIKDIRNQTAHLTTSAISTEEFEKVVESLNKHIKALELTNVDLSRYVVKLQTVKNQKKPVLQHVYKERERHDTLVKRQIADRKYFSTEYKRLDREKHFLKTNIDHLKTKEKTAENDGTDEENGNTEENTEDQSHKHSLTTKYESLESDYNHLNKVTEDLNNKGSVDPEELKSENDYLEQIMVDTNKTHAAEIDRLKSENDFMKQILTHSSELVKLKQTLADMKKKHAAKIERLESEHSAEVQKLISENAILKQTINERNDRGQCGIQKNTNIYQMLVCYHVCIFIIITFLHKMKMKTIK
ncbi:uncharacterized protein LOC128553960 [Mercenaria mercenaria]|uniref:uncharacterized protein LOC128553960 n=1 Tax=Mercenaria mercenaria TaxID=6596 RepID=UPI00234EDB59|nr:uncharacterized protein LOC128553960 [Mercenaria mercenaria]